MPFYQPEVARNARHDTSLDHSPFAVPKFELSEPINCTDLDAEEVSSAALDFLPCFSLFFLQKRSAKSES